MIGVGAIEDGHFLQALEDANRGRKKGPWKVICDNENLLLAPESKAAHKKIGGQLVKIPAHSPDFNFVELYIFVILPVSGYIPKCESWEAPRSHLMNGSCY